MLFLCYFKDGTPSIESSGNMEEEGFCGIGKHKPKHKWHALTAFTQRLSFTTVFYKH